MKYLEFLFFTSLVINTVFPSSFLFELKAIVFTGLILELIRTFKLRLTATLFLIVIGNLLLSFAIGVSTDNEYAPQAFSAYFIFFTLLFSHLYAFETIIKRSDVVSVLLKTSKFLTLGVIGYIIFKYIIYALIVAEISTVEFLKEIIPGLIINKFYNQAILTRIFSTSDLIIVFLIIFRIWLAKNHLLRNNRFIIPLLTVAAIFSLNRYVWLILIIGFLLLTNNQTKVRIVKWLLILLLSCTIFLTDYFILFIEYLNIKFSDHTSLGVKNLQAKYIFNDILKNPLFGNGIGWYNTEIIRDYDQPFQYETQLLSLFSQFGAITFVLIFFSIFRSLLPFNQRNKLSVKFVNISFIVLWFASGFTNPYLTVIGSIPIYILLKGLSFQDLHY